MGDSFLKFEDWEKTIADYIKRDPLWESIYYRLALYLYDLVWDDCDLLQKDFKGRHNIPQIIHSSGALAPIWKKPLDVGLVRPITFVS